MQASRGDSREARKTSPNVDIPIVFNSWKDDPLQQLICEIRTTIDDLMGYKGPPLPAGELGRAVEAAASETNATLLLMLDQFEEYFLYAGTDPNSHGFADQLATCINMPRLRAIS